MQRRWLAPGIVGGVAAVLTATACTAQTTEPAAPNAAASTGSSSTAPSTTGAVAASSSAAAPNTWADSSDPSEVATDPPVTLAPGQDATVFVTYVQWNAGAGAVEEGSYVQGVVETGGTCTLTLTKGATTVTRTAAAEPDATTTSCGGMSVPGSKVSAGTWSAVVRYESSTTQGSSEPTEVTVP